MLSARAGGLNARAKTFMKYVIIIAIAILFYAGMVAALKKRPR
jgi:hypothetical protein